VPDTCGVTPRIGMVRHARHATPAAGITFRRRILLAAALLRADDGIVAAKFAARGDHKVGACSRSLSVHSIIMCFALGWSGSVWASIGPITSQR
jgi:hypothetical protein